MASVNDRDFGTAKKASVLTARETADAAEGSKRTRNRVFGDDATVGSPSGRRGGAVWVDLILLVVLVAVVVGGVLGYRAVKNAYAPAWEEKEIVFVVELSAIDEAILPDYWHAEAPLYTSNATDAAPLGYLMDRPEILPTSATAEDGRVCKTVRLALHNKVSYREGQGYFCGNTRILAGLSGDLRIDGISGVGMITAVYEVDEYVAETTTAQTPAGA